MQTSPGSAAGTTDSRPSPAGATNAPDPAPTPGPTPTDSPTKADPSLNAEHSSWGTPEDQANTSSRKPMCGPQRLLLGRSESPDNAPQPLPGSGCAAPQHGDWLLPPRAACPARVAPSRITNGKKAPCESAHSGHNSSRGGSCGPVHRTRDGGRDHRQRQVHPEPPIGHSHSICSFSGLQDGDGAASPVPAEPRPELGTQQGRRTARPRLSGRHRASSRATPATATPASWSTRPRAPEPSHPERPVTPLVWPGVLGAVPAARIQPLAGFGLRCPGGPATRRLWSLCCRLRQCIAARCRRARGLPAEDAGAVGGRLVRLRRESGLSPKTAAQARAAIPGSWAACSVVHTETGETVGMARVLGDGGWYFHVVDMAVLPEHQRRGVGDAIMSALVQRIRESTRRVPTSRCSPTRPAVGCTASTGSPRPPRTRSAWP